jgi:phage-related protein
MRLGASGVGGCKRQCGETLGLPLCRRMPVIGPRCHELRINDAAATFRIIYRADPDAVIILEVFSKKTQQTPRMIIEACKHRLRSYDRVTAKREVEE